MSQHDFTIDNQTFPATRSDINSALQALASLSSGASSPSTTFAYQLWVDTTADPNILNIRNSANNAWIKIGEVNQGSAAFILTAYAILQAGSAAAPSFSFDVDRDTGMYRAAANIIGFATNGTERFRVGDSGQLGIGGATYGTSGQVLTSGGASAAPSWATPASSGQLIRAPRNLSSGTSYTTPSGCNSILVEMWGGGGGGGTGADGSSGDTASPGTGGGGGAYLRQYIAVSPSTAYTIAIGAAGAAGAIPGTTSAGNNGTAGGTTSIIVSGTTYSCTGGGAGSGGRLSTTGANVTQAASAAGGTATGVSGLEISGGGAERYNLNFTAGMTPANGWGGGNSFAGPAGYPGVTNGGPAASTVTTPGTGGSGGGSSNTTTVSAASAGGAGRMLIWEFT